MGVKTPEEKAKKIEDFTVYNSQNPAHFGVNNGTVLVSVEKESPEMLEILLENTSEEKSLEIQVEGSVSFMNKKLGGGERIFTFPLKNIQKKQGDNLRVEISVNGEKSLVGLNIKAVNLKYRP